MSRVRRLGLGGLCLIAATLGALAVCVAADDPQEQFLISKGLKQSGPYFILATEAEAKSKFNEVKQLSRQLKYAKAQQQAFGTAQDRDAYVRNMTAQVNQIRAESKAVGQQMNQLPRSSGRYGGRYSNYLVQGQRAQMQAYRNQLNAEVNQQNALLNRIKSKPFDSKTKDKLDSDVKSRQDEYQQAVNDLVQVVKTTKEKYSELTKDEVVKKALDALELKIRPSPKLGPSHEFHEMLKTVEKLEKEAAADSFSDSSSSTKPAKATKSRRSKSSH